MRTLALAASALLIAGPAHALDAEKTPPAPTFEACPAKGAGFVRLPGSHDCTRISGHVAAGADLRARPGAATLTPPVAGRLAIDNRTDSDLGEVRTYLRIGNGRR